MESSIWLFAFLYSREKRTCLSTFLAVVHHLRAGVKLFSSEFLLLHPDLKTMAEKHSRKEQSQILEGLCQSVSQGQILIYPGHCFFPKDYLTLYEVPYLLRMRGSPIWLTEKGLSIVGHREPSQLTLDWMNEHLSTFFRKQNCFTVSGGARGVDQKAHLLSLRTGTPTVALLPSGLNEIYPTSFAALMDDILENGGAVLSEYEDHQKMQKHLFAQRNRLIAGLGRATLIVEARRHSGTLLTAQESIEQSKPVWILTGHPMDPRMHGSLDLLNDGGTPVRDADDLRMLFESEVQI